MFISVVFTLLEIPNQAHSSFIADIMDNMLMCYFCGYLSNNATELLIHTIQNHKTKDVKFSLRQRFLDESTGLFLYRSQHYNITLDQICQRLEDQQQISIDCENKRIQFKRKIKCLDLSSETDNDEDAETGPYRERTEIT